jgi:mannose-6-phosphate isomerase-like protein (cupin superfamily)
MTPFASRMLPAAPDVLAPDSSQVRILLALDGGSMAHFQLEAGQVSRAVRHRGVAEIWYVLSGRGEMWRATDEHSEITALQPGLSLTIPAGTSFQFRASDDGPLAAVAVTMPPWPGEDEAILVAGPWPPQTRELGL